MEDRKIKAVVFDLDGTLLDTVKDIGAGANMALHHVGLPEHPIENYIQFVGHGIRTLFRQAVGDDVPEDTYEKAVAFYLSYYPEHCDEHSVMFPGIRELLDGILTSGRTVAVLSNKTEKTTLRIIDKYFPDVPFAFVWGNNGVRPLKPNTDAGYALCETLGLVPGQIAYVGDGDSDMEFASKMGFYAVGVTWGYRSREQLLAAGADVLVDNAQELAATLSL